MTGLAATQHGVVGRRQLLAAGLRIGQVDGLVRRRRLEPAADGVYVVPGCAPTVLRDAAVAVQRCGPAARVAGPALLAALGVPHLHGEERFTVLLQPGRHVQNVTWPLRHDAWADLGTRARVDGLPSFGVARNLLEAVADPGAGHDDVLALVDAVRWHRGDRLGDVRRLAGRAPDHPGALRLAALGVLAEDSPESEPERWLVELLDEFGPATQVAVAPDLRVDVLIRQARLVVEYDGRGAHAGPAARRRDTARDARLRALGYLVVHVTAEDRRHPAVLLARIRAIVAAAC